MGRAQQLSEGDDIVMVAAVEWRRSRLVRRPSRRRRDSVGVVVVSCLSPPPIRDLVRALSAVPLALSVEAHYVTGGLARSWPR